MHLACRNTHTHLELRLGRAQGRVGKENSWALCLGLVLNWSVKLGISSSTCTTTISKLALLDSSIVRWRARACGPACPPSRSGLCVLARGGRAGRHHDDWLVGSTARVSARCPAGPGASDATLGLKDQSRGHPHSATTLDQSCSTGTPESVRRVSPCDSAEARASRRHPRHMGGHRAHHLGPRRIALAIASTGRAAAELSMRR